MFIATLAIGQNSDSSLSQVSAKIESIENKIEKIEDRNASQFDKLDNRIDGINYSVVQQLAVPIIIGLITFVLGLLATKRQMRVITDDKIKEWLEKIAPPQCEIALQAYLKSSFPGNLEFLMAAAKNIAYDQELRQLKTIRVIGLKQDLSQRIVDQLRNNDFLQVEFVQFSSNMSLPKADLILIDKYSCIALEEPMDDSQVGELIKRAKSSAENPAVHYFGKFNPGLPQIMTEKHALSSAQFSLIPNIMDQLRFVFPKQKSQSNAQ